MTYADLKDALINNPVASAQDIADATGEPLGRVKKALRLVLAEGYDRQAAGKQAVEQWRANHDGATVLDIAAHFKTSPARVGNLLGYAHDDDNLFYRRCLRPSWYVEEVTKNGYLGIFLPEKYFLTYLDYYERKRRGGSTR